MTLDYYTLDVFTDRVFGGNPLAVFPDPGPLDTRTMQKIAREMNLSESVFVFPPETADGLRRVRIFTPSMEVPFAGHPTVGTAFFLASTGAVPVSEPSSRIVLEEAVGPVPVAVHWEDGRPVSCRLTAAITPEFRPVPFPPDDLAALVSLEIEHLAPAPAPAFVSAGIPFLILPVRDLEAARACRLDTAVWERLLAGAWTRMVYVVTTEAEDPNADAHVRMFAPGAGVPEDPATGSAAAALAAYLGRHDGRSEGTLAWTVEQGLEIGRPSRLDIEADVADGEVVRVHVSGRSVLVGRGTLDLGDVT